MKGEVYMNELTEMDKVRVLKKVVDNYRAKIQVANVTYNDDEALDDAKDVIYDAMDRTIREVAKQLEVDKLETTKALNAIMNTEETKDPMYGKLVITKYESYRKDTPDSLIYYQAIMGALELWSAQDLL